ncbi:LutC/YkgG family protein [Chitinasiproducens palmae]|uniref:L-lactate dehydrogenase complex protein LldG n=1 Tax=Chitinasiproducens palmae TaxID=1770053 RepID=A0A1H2PTB8_9BURK|nr:LUD domain-containing protein [Chitinasiproducens palmae]SDV50349.1 L-lactate dehydrogenase complex protein LldG [Chitinasiproducens palmae]
MKEARAGRAAFLARVRAAQPPARPRPRLPMFEPLSDRPLVERFEAALAPMGGQCVTLANEAAVQGWLEERFGAARVVCSAVPGVPGTRALAPQTAPASLHDVDIGVVRARFGVAETGSVWFSEAEYVVNALGYLAQHLVVLLDPAALLDGLQQVYQRAEFHTARYAALVTGPSATADIEGVMIHGAQGVRSLTVLWIAAPTTC